MITKKRKKYYKPRILHIRKEVVEKCARLAAGAFHLPTELIILINQVAEEMGYEPQEISVEITENDKEIRVVLMPIDKVI